MVCDSSQDKLQQPGHILNSGKAKPLLFKHSSTNIKHGISYCFKQTHRKTNGTSQTTEQDSIQSTKICYNPHATEVIGCLYRDPGRGTNLSNKTNNSR